MLSLIPLALTPERFASFGAVVRQGAPLVVNEGFAQRRDVQLELEGREPGARMCLSLFDVSVRPAPLLVRQLERHPWSAQVFLPVDGCRALVVVAGSTPDGGIDPVQLAAFIAGPEDGILYAPGVWHLGLSSLDRPARFHMAMWSGTRPDTELCDLPEPVQVEMAAAGVPK